MEEIEPLLTTGEVARIFRVDRRTVIRWADAGRLAVTRTPGNHRRFKQSEIRAHLDANTQECDAA
ncbi:BldC family transcriptional regulator [Streptomyces sp. NPDC046925]|uniref:BldC family transcriptional regulator n=1 Tax=Streptomyces sp. NPDC046925 TaxID=3155375 RepID=UPI0033EECDDC